MNTFNKLFSMCAILALGVGCADVSTESLESADRLEAAGHEVTFLDASEESVPEAKPAATCPDGWVDTSIIAIDCAPGYIYTTKDVKGIECATCKLAKCGGDWIAASAEIKCAAGYEVVYNNKGTCKKCALAKTPDCQVGGCSGELCYDPATSDGISTCIFKPEYACYQEANCGNFGPGGSCAWEQTAELTECIEANSGTTSTL